MTPPDSSNEGGEPGTWVCRRWLRIVQSGVVIGGGDSPGGRTSWTHDLHELALSSRKSKWRNLAYLVGRASAPQTVTRRRRRSDKLAMKSVLARSAWSLPRKAAADSQGACGVAVVVRRCALRYRYARWRHALLQ